MGDIKEYRCNMKTFESICKFDEHEIIHDLKKGLTKFKNFKNKKLKNKNSIKEQEKGIK